MNELFWSNHRLQDVMWSGGALHLHTSDGSPPTQLHAHFALQITIGLLHPVALNSDGSAREHIANGWLIASNQAHSIDRQRDHITIFLDPLSVMGRRVRGRIGNRRLLAFSSDEYDAIKFEFMRFERRGDGFSAVVDRIVHILTSDVDVLPRPDVRVQTVIDELAINYDDHTSVRDLAAKVQLSESRLAHLFTRDIGIPIRQYRLWLRVQETIARTSRGQSLTESAHAAGFSDSSHFCRICKRMFGSTPSSLPRFELKEGRSLMVDRLAPCAT